MTVLATMSLRLNKVGFLGLPNSRSVFNFGMKNRDEKITKLGTLTPQTIYYFKDYTYQAPFITLPDMVRTTLLLLL